MALQQRATLLNLVLRDLFGEPSLLKNGVLPPDVVYAHPGFLRPCHGHGHKNGSFLHYYAADVARSPDGRWRVLADRTESPSGLGYLLENRVIISRMLPEVFNECQVERLAPFFISAKEALRELAPQRRENPRFVLLSNGPADQNYFEDAYLARYLGYTLVEGGDLAVRQRQVMLKTLGGLQRVDVIVRRQNSRECDPLELGADAGAGVAGLTQAVRAGKVAVANALGSGLVESPVFMAFMPQLCQALLGEPLKIEGVATWWCGCSKGLEYVLNNLDSLQVQFAFRRRGSDSLRDEQLAELSSSKLAEAIRSNPTQFVARDKFPRSTAPIWSNGVTSADVALRTYLVAKQGSYLVMPGALGRVPKSQEPLEASLRKGERSKDVWILADGPVDQITLLDSLSHPIALRRTGDELPSRAADDLFWLGRQLERAESSARLLRSTASRLAGETRSTSDIEIPVLVRCLADLGQIEPGYAIEKMRDQLPNLAEVLPFSVFDRRESTCLRSVIDQLFRLGTAVRDRMSQEAWRIIHHMDEGFQRASRGGTNLSSLEVKIDNLIIELAAFSGVVMESTTRTQAFRFLELGRRLERAIQIISLVKNSLVPLPEVLGPVLETVLEVADSIMTYRSRYLANLQLAAVLDLLLTDETNPRSLAYQLVQLAEQVEKLPRDASLSGYSREQRIAMSLVHSIRMLDIREASELHSMGDVEPLENLIAGWETQLPQLSEAISHHYLIHSGPAKQLSEISRENL